MTDGKPVCATNGCGRPVNGTRICTSCTRQIASALRQVPGLTPELELTLTRQRRFNDLYDDLNKSTAETPLPYATSAGDAVAELRKILIGWTVICRDEYGTPFAFAESLAAMAGYIRSHLTPLATHEASSTLRDDIVDAVDQAQKVIDAPRDRSSFTVGPCPQPGEQDGTRCKGTVKAHIPRDPDDRPTMHCPTCDTTWYAEQWHHVGGLILKRRQLSTQGWRGEHGPELVQFDTPAVNH